jgi:O-antigen/teichoic acid export membrane protein
VAIFASTLALGGTDLLMIGTLLGSSAAGPYRAGAQIAAVVAFPMTALNLALASRIATAHAAGDLTRLQRLATLAARIGGSIGLGLAVLVWTMGPWLLRWFGTGFEEAHSTMTILSLAFAIHAASGTAGYMLIMTEHAGTAARWFALAAVAALLLQWLLIPLLGTVGAALGTLAGLAVLAFGLTRATRRLLGISTGLIGQ